MKIKLEIIVSDILFDDLMSQFCSKHISIPLSKLLGEKDYILLEMSKNYNNPMTGELSDGKIKLAVIDEL